MADLVITAANVLPGTGAATAQGTFGETVTAGQGLYKNSTDGKLYRSQASSGQTLAQATFVGLAAEGGAAGQPAVYYRGGTVITGATTVKGQLYGVSAANPGGIAPVSDLVATNWVSAFAVATDTVGTLKFMAAPFNTGVVHG